MKADLTNRLDEFNPGIWEELNAERPRNRDQNLQQNNGVLPVDDTARVMNAKERKKLERIASATNF